MSAAQQPAEAAGREASAACVAGLHMERGGITRGRSLAAARWAAWPQQLGAESRDDLYHTTDRLGRT